MANGRDALIWLVNNHWERLAIGLKVRKGVARIYGHPLGSAIARQGNLWGKS
jgi:hypothetical protein